MDIKPTFLLQTRRSNQPSYAATFMATVDHIIMHETNHDRLIIDASFLKLAKLYFKKTIF